MKILLRNMNEKSATETNRYYCILIVITTVMSVILTTFCVLYKDNTIDSDYVNKIKNINT